MVQVLVCSYCFIFFFEFSCDHLDLHVLTHSFPTRRSADLMSCGATYALVPFVDRKALGGVAGIVGAGGSVGAVAAGFLMKGVGDVQQTVIVLAGFVMFSVLCAIAVRFRAGHQDEAGAAAVALAR